MGFLISLLPSRIVQMLRLHTVNAQRDNIHVIFLVLILLLIKHVFSMWMVSNCHATNARELYIRQLKRYMPLYVYGACGRFKLPYCYKNHQKLESCIEHEQTVINKYKFYFAFANSFCEDYITEEAFRAIRGESNPLPIVMGGGPYDPYLPRGSYLDVNQFSGPKALADHLHFLDTNDEEYNKYFQWKINYTCQWVNPHCSLCDSLYELRNKRNVARNMHQVFGQYQCSIRQTYSTIFHWWM